MQIFLPHKSVYLTAIMMKTHDPRRFNKQIIECRQIINAIKGFNKNEKRPWYHHPIVKMYKDDLNFIKFYLKVFESVAKDDLHSADEYAELCGDAMPEFLLDADWYFENMRKRLYTKSPESYEEYEESGKSYSNFYYVNGEWKEYKQK